MSTDDPFQVMTEGMLELRDPFGVNILTLSFNLPKGYLQVKPGTYDKNLPTQNENQSCQVKLTIL